MSSLTVTDLMQRYGVSQHTVLAWIDAGDLKAVDVSRKRGGRPRWRITAEALEQFEASRTKAPPAPKKPRRKKSNEAVTEFYK